MNCSTVVLGEDSATKELLFMRYFPSTSSTQAWTLGHPMEDGEGLLVALRLLNEDSNGLYPRTVCGPRTLATVTVTGTAGAEMAVSIRSSFLGPNLARSIFGRKIAWALFPPAGEVLAYCCDTCSEAFSADHIYEHGVGPLYECPECGRVFIDEGSQDRCPCCGSKGEVLSEEACPSCGEGRLIPLVKQPGCSGGAE